MTEGATPNREIVAPRPAAMVEALRGVGYSPATAIADLLDNSIAAGARRIRIDIVWRDADPCVTVLDDGCGMSREELVSAMRCGDRNPRDARGDADLGRFGLGLKTASFSQCRRLTVASRRAGEPVSVRRWDLDRIAEVNEWELLTGPAPGSEALVVPLDDRPAGTIVAWERLDRVAGGVGGSPLVSRDGFLELIDRVKRHLGMVFHRFLEGAVPDVIMHVNGDDEPHRVKPWDPFMQKHPATQCFPAETIRTAGGEVAVRGYVLPHKDRLEADELELAAGPDGWTAQQGFYVYRNRRMLVSGTWLGLSTGGKAWTKEEPFRLARLSLDFPNTADEEWRIDIRKSTARPPQSVQRRLHQLADRVRTLARRVFAFRGDIARAAGPHEQPLQVWRSTPLARGVAYRVDRDHPVVKSILEQSAGLRPSLEALLRVIEETVPVQRIWLDTVEKDEVQGQPFGSATAEDVARVADGLFRFHVDRLGMSPDEALKRLSAVEPFRSFPDIIESLRGAARTAPRG